MHLNVLGNVKILLLRFRTYGYCELVGLEVGVYLPGLDGDALVHVVHQVV